MIYQNAFYSTKYVLAIISVSSKQSYNLLANQYLSDLLVRKLNTFR